MSADPIPRRGPRLLLALVSALTLGLLSWLAGTYLVGNSQVSVTAVFSDSSPLVPGNNVELYGVNVGTISEITLVNGQAHVRMSLDRAVLPLHIDATAKITPVSLLGERFIALTQGSESAPALTEPLTIPVTRTGSSVDLDQLLNTLDDPTSTALAAMVSTLGETVAGQGGNVAQSLQALAPTLHQTDQLSTLLDQQNAVLNDFVVAVQKNTTALAQPMDSLVGTAQQTFGVVAANRAALNDALVELPGTLSSARRSLTQFGRTADNATDVLSGIRPVTDNLRAVSNELGQFADATDPAMVALPGVLERINHMLDEARPVVNDLGPAASNLSTASTAVNALSNQVFTHAAGKPSQFDMLLTGMADWAMASSGYDGLSHYFRAVVIASPSALGSTGLGGIPPIGTQPPFNPIPPDPNGKSGYPGTAPLPFLAPGPNPDGDGNSSHSVPGQDQGGASGLTPQQEGDMFDQLLGGGH